MRATETCLKFFRSYERYMYGETSDTVRDLLNRTEKMELVSSVRKWMEMRDTRKRIVHDYLPEQVKKLYDLIMFDYGEELQYTRQRIEAVDL